MTDKLRIDHQDSNAVPARLKELIRQYDLRYEVWPEWLMVKGERTKVGFNLELFARHGKEAGHVSPGCYKCRSVFNQIQEVAGWIIPEEERASSYEVEPFEPVWEESPTEKLTPEITLTIRIAHRHGFDLPVDECETRCLKEMTGKLDALGVRSGKRRMQA